MKKSVLFFFAAAIIVVIAFVIFRRPQLHGLYQSEVIQEARRAVPGAAMKIEAGFKTMGIPFDSSKPAYLEFSDPPQIEVIVDARGPYAQFTFRNGVLHVDNGASSPWFDVAYVSEDRLEADGLVFRKAK